MTYEALLSAVEKATGRDRDLDARVAQTFERPWYCFTHNITRVVEITERELPGWRWIIDSDFDRGPPYAAQVKKRGDTWADAPRAYAYTPALALLVATLRALIANGLKAADPEKANG